MLPFTFFKKVSIPNSLIIRIVTVQEQLEEIIFDLWSI